MTQSRTHWNRRQILKGLSLFGAGAAAASLPGGRMRRAHAAGANGTDPKFLIVLCASGGASIIDSVMAIRASESANSSTLNCFPDAQVTDIADSPFRAVDMSGTAVGAIPAQFTANQSAFVSKHHRDMMVATLTGTSVNHAVAQRRAITGNEAWYGRTLQEAVALQYGTNYPLPNVHLVTGSSFTEKGTDPSLPSNCYGEIVPDLAHWPLALDGTRGIAHPVAKDQLARARKLRNQILDANSDFVKTFGQSARLDRWRTLRDAPQQTIESQDLISKLMLFPDSEEYPLSAHGLAASPSGALVRERFPNFATDPLEAQAALAFLLLKYRVSVSVTLGPSFDLVLNDDVDIGVGGLAEGVLANPPLAFDFSHQGHRTTQAMMWDRLYSVADRLIDLLKAEEYADGQSMWDRSLLYVATDFGRSKTRPQDAEDWGTAHDLNNGIMVMSPLVNGNTMLGGVDADTGMTYGFNPKTGAPEPGRTMTEPEIYAGILQALGVDTAGSGLPDMPAMRRQA